MDNLPDDLLGKIPGLLNEGVQKMAGAALEEAGKEIGKEVGKQIVARQFDNNTAPALDQHEAPAPPAVRKWHHRLPSFLGHRATILALITILTLGSTVSYVALVAEIQQGYETIYLTSGNDIFPLHSMLSADSKEQELLYDTIVNARPQAIRDYSGEREISVGPGRKILRIWLPDSIFLILGPLSQAVLSEGFENGTREISIVGKAFLQVPLRNQALNIKTPNGQKISAKKGGLVVTAYPESDFEAALIEGDISVEIDKTTHTPAPGNAVVQEWDKQEVSSKIIDTAMALSWKKGCYAFIEEPLYAVFRHLERIYPERIIVEDDKTGFQPYTGFICKDNSLVDVLKSMEDIGFRFDNCGIVHVWKRKKNKLTPSPLFK